MALIDYSTVFDQAWSPLNTLMRGKLALAERDMARRDRLADQEEQRNFLLEMERQRDLRYQAHDKAMTERQMTAIEAQNKALMSRSEKLALAAATAKAKGLGLSVAATDTVGDLEFKINQHEQGAAARAYQAFEKKIADNNKQASSILSKVDDQRVKAATVDILSSGVVNDYLTAEQKKELQAYVTPGLKHENGTAVQAKSPMAILAEIGQSKWGAPGTPQKRVTGFGSAFSAAIEKQSGKNDPRILEIQTLYEDNRRLIDGADKLMANPAVAELILSRSSTPSKTDETVRDTGLDFLKGELTAAKPATQDLPTAPATPKTYASTFGETNPFAGVEPRVTPGPTPGTQTVTTPSFASRALTGAGRFIKGLVPAPESMFFPRQAMAMAKAPFQSQQTVVPMPSIPAAPVTPPPQPTGPSMEDIQGMRELAIQDGYDDAQMKAIVEGAQRGDPMAIQLMAKYHDRYQAAKLQMTFSGGEPIPGIDDAYDFSGALR